MRFSLLILLIFISSCSYKWWESNTRIDRKVASISSQDQQKDQILSMFIDDKLQLLHGNYILSQVKLQEFDKILAHHDLDSLYHSRSYLDLLTLKIQITTIENELKDLWDRRDSRDLLMNRIEHFLQGPKIRGQSLRYLSKNFNLALELDLPSSADLDQEVRNLKEDGQLQVYEKTTQHLGHLFGMKIRRIPADKEDHFSEFQITANLFSKNEWGVVSSTGHSLRFLPTASGLTEPSVRVYLSQNDFRDIIYNVDALDWPPQSIDKIIQRTRLMIEKSRNSAGIILFHRSEISHKALAQVRDELVEKNHRICRIGEISPVIDKEVQAACTNI